MSGENQIKVIYQEVPRDFRTEIPNIVFELLESGEISANDLALYALYRRIAGEHGGCWVGQRKLAQKCRLDDKTIKKSKTNLSRKFDQLGGKSLIEIIPCNRKSETPEIVSIVDIWLDNHLFFKNKLTCRNPRDGGVGIRGTRVSESTGQKKEPYKKELIEEVIITEDPEPPKPLSPKSKDMPAGGNNNKFYQCLEKCNDLSPRQKSQLNKYPEEVVEQAVKYCYHPSTKLEGPQARIKQLHAFCKDPVAYEDTMKNLDNPDKGKSLKQKIKDSFKNGEIYDNYRCEHDDKGITFYCIGAQGYYQFTWSDPNFKQKWQEFINKRLKK